MSTIGVTPTNTPTNPGSRVAGAARLHYLTNPWAFVWAPLIVFFGLLAVFVAIAAIAGPGGGTSLGPIMAVFFMMQAYQSVSSVFSLSQALGLTRREYLAGAGAVGLIGAVILSIALTVLGAAEHVTEGFGLGVHLSYSPAVFDRGLAAALATWLITLLGAYIAGLFAATLRQRFGSIAIWVAILGVVVVIAAAAAVIGYLDAWPQVGNWVGRVGPFGVALWAIPLEIIAAAATSLILRRTPA